MVTHFKTEMTHDFTMCNIFTGKVFFREIEERIEDKI